MTDRTAAGRVLAVLDAFDEARPRLTLSEISRRSGLSLTTTHRLVGELLAWGGLTRLESGSYTIGMRLFELGLLAPNGLELREAAIPFLGDLHHATRANVHLGVRQGYDVVYVESLRASDGAHVSSRIGGRWPLTITGTGLVLLAHADTDFQNKVLARPLPALTSASLTDPVQVRRTLAEIRRTGVAIVENALTEGVVAIAVPVRGERDQVVASLSVTAPTGTPPHTVIPALVTTARAVSRALGAPSALPRPH